jgi:hypothetical protein
VCGADGPLTFEHVPPRSTFNRQRAEILGMDAWLRRDAGGPSERGKILQRGSGFYTLCEDCNNRAGRLYVPEFRRWVGMGMEILFGNGGASRRYADCVHESYVTVEMREMRPARFVKQVITMLLAMSPARFAALNPELCAYAQDPAAVGLPEHVQLYLTFFSGPCVRYIGGAGTMRNIGTDKPLEVHYVLELAYPPFAYVLSVDEETPVLKTGNITSFADVTTSQQGNLEMQLINGYGHTPIPLDYRTLPALEADRAANVRERATL